MVAVASSGQTVNQQANARPAASAAPVIPGAIVPPPGYVIGPEDVLAVLFWREKDLSGDVAVRPDGKITLPLINDVEAAGLTPDELRDHVTKAASQYVEDPNVTVVVKAINSRKVFITGNIAKPGPYPLTGPTTVLQLLAMAGGVHEFAKTDRILIMRTEGGKAVAHKFNYKEVAQGKKLTQNMELQPGDTVVVP
jgi:polysaccharide export outer membrane protein